ncbi:hypothetical protein [Olivibacter ginsenosidimutans]|uniref:hypothetical protein n=1 Tax=Olivibacter ginsenosidimutans TaxID=1176537 RepID=UPI0031EE5BD9
MTYWKKKTQEKTTAGVGTAGFPGLILGIQEGLTPAKRALPQAQKAAGGRK